MSVKQILSGKIPFVKKLFFSLELKTSDPGELEIFLDNELVFQASITSDRTVDIGFIDSNNLQDRTFEAKMNSGSVVVTSLKIDNLDSTKLLFSKSPVCVDPQQPLFFNFQTPIYRWLLIPEHVTRLL